MAQSFIHILQTSFGTIERQVLAAKKDPYQAVAFIHQDNSNEENLRVCICGFSNKVSLVTNFSIQLANRLFIVGLIVLFSGSMLGCNRSYQERPYGFLRLGSIYDFISQDSTYLEDKYLVIRQDDRGLFAMSTLCSHDLNQTVQISTGTAAWECPLCHSKFSNSGQVLSGPAVHPLPYYALLVDSNNIDDPKNELYVKIGVKVSPDWRLKVHLIEPQGALKPEGDSEREHS